MRHDIVITEHAKERARERLNLNESSLLKMAAKAFEFGLKHSDMSGKLRRYADSIFLSYKTANNIRIHGEFLFIFSDNRLITVYQLRLDVRKVALKQQNK